MPILFRIEYAGVFNVHDRIAVELLPAQIDFDRRIEIILPEPRVGAADRHAGNTQPPVEIEGRKIFAIELLELNIGFADQSMFLGTSVTSTEYKSTSIRGRIDSSGAGRPSRAAL